MITEARNSTVAVVSTSRPSGRSDRAGAGEPPRRAGCWRGGDGGHGVRAEDGRSHHERRSPRSGAGSGAACSSVTDFCRAMIVRRVVEEGVGVARDRDLRRLLEQRRRTPGRRSGSARTFAELGAELGVVGAARVHQPGAAEQHLEGLHRRLAAGEAVVGQRLGVVEVDDLGELGRRDRLDLEVDADLLELGLDLLDGGRRRGRGGERALHAVLRARRRPGSAWPSRGRRRRGRRARRCGRRTPSGTAGS